MTPSVLNNEKGVALVIALIMLIVLTFIGISSISSSVFETKISGNERVGSSAFYAAEGSECRDKPSPGDHRLFRDHRK